MRLIMHRKFCRRIRLFSTDPTIDRDNPFRHRLNKDKIGSYKWSGPSLEDATKMVDTIDISRLYSLAQTMNWGTPLTSQGHLRPGSHWVFHNHNKLRNLQRQDGNNIGFENFRRMWAGGSLEFVERMKPNVKISKISELHEVVSREKDRPERSKFKYGSAGALLFLHWSENLYNENGDMLLKEIRTHAYTTDLQYKARRGEKLEVDVDYTEEWKPDIVQLFRFSALTFNSHRIHYDLRYATEIEKYPNLVVHGPLVALQLLTFLERASGRHVGYFKYRCMKPGFLTQKIELAANIDGDSYEAWAVNPKGEILVRAEGNLNGP